MTTKRILVVDDSKVERNLFCSLLLQSAALDVLEAGSAEEALLMLETEKVDLVVMDFTMPGIGGVEGMLAIRKKWNALELPIVMFTARTDDAAVLNCLENGANDYLTKPVIPAVALSRINLQLRLVEVSQHMAQLKELAALDSTIATYNHEINNPLAIAIGWLSHDLSEPAKKEKLSVALWRIAKIVKNISDLNAKRELEIQRTSPLFDTLKIS